MQLLLAAVGKSRPGPERALFEHYQRRLSWPFGLKEVEEKRPLPVAERVRREGDLLLAQVPPGAVLVALDERGRQFDSPAFARRLADWRDEGRGHLVFAIGGADGHSDFLRARADILMSFGMMTWPHMLVRGMLTEQIYRAECILSNHPYHRGRE